MTDMTLRGALSSAVWLASVVLGGAAFAEKPAVWWASQSGKPGAHMMLAGGGWATNGTTRVLVGGREIVPDMVSTDGIVFAWPDGLGTGIYFWEEAPVRAYEWAIQQHPDEPAVIGAKIKLGRCLNLMDIAAFTSLRQTFDVLKQTGVALPKNGKHYHRLDCLVINTATGFAEKKLGLPYDTVRSPFPEGEPVFPGSMILDRSHIQIAVRNPSALAELFTVDISRF